MEEDNRTFEECLPIINSCIEKYRSRWTLTSLNWYDFDDAKSSITIHLMKKWETRDKKRDIKPWVITIVSNQLKNIVRNNYGKFKRPCLSCEHILNGTECSKYETQCSKCPLFAKWEKAKARGYELNYPSSYHNQNDPTIHQQANDISGALVDIPENCLFLIKEELKKRISKELYEKFMIFYYFKNSKKKCKLTTRERKRLFNEVKEILQKIFPLE